MISTFTSIIIALLCLAVLCFCLAYWCWKAPRIAGATPLVLLHVAIAVWAVLLIIQFVIADESFLFPFTLAQGWLRAIAALAALAFLLDHTAHHRILLLGLRSGGTITILLLLIIGLINDNPNAWIAHSHVVHMGPFLLLASFSSTLRRTAEVVGITLILISMGLQIAALRHMQMLHQRTLVNSLLATTAPFSGIIMSRLMYGADVQGFALYTDFLFIATIPIFTVSSLLNNQLLTVMPFARDVVLDEISDAVIILDKDDTVLDANIAAVTALGTERRNIVGHSLLHIDTPLASKLSNELRPGTTTLVMDSESPQQERTIYEVQTKSIRRPNSKQLGLLVKLHNVTREYTAKRELALTLSRERQHMHTLTLLRLSMQRMSESLEIEPLTDVIERHAIALTNADSCMILALDNTHQKLIPITDYIGTTRAEISHQHVPWFDQQTLAHLATQDVVIHNDSHAWMKEHGIDVGACESVASMLVPLLRNEKMIGILCVGRRSKDRPFNEEDGQLLTLFAQQVVIALENVRLYTSVRQQATTDALTGVLSRQQLVHMLSEEWSCMKSHREPLSIIMFDADHFKHVNDTYGHPVGDQVLRAIAGRARGILRAQDMIGRYGGEEFVVLVPRTDAGTVHIIAERLRRAVSATPIATNGGSISMSISVGVATTSLSDMQHATPDALIDDADRAMYLAKRSGRNRVVHAALVETPQQA